MRVQSLSRGAVLYRSFNQPFVLGAGVDAGVTRCHTTWDANGNEITTTEVVVSVDSLSFLKRLFLLPKCAQAWRLNHRSRS